MSKFIKELKRRNVIKSTIAYLVVAWMLLQVFTLLLPIIGAPEWIVQGITLVLAIGLPIWIIVSWVYDLTPQGLEKTSDDPQNDLVRHATNKRLNAFIIASLSVAVVVMGLKISGVFSSNSDTEYSIAVLPFVNMSNDEEQEYFSDGISEEIINMLAQVPRLTVMGRTSSFAFKGKNMDLKLIGEALNVSYLLEGSVRRSGNTLRITAQLINVADGSHLYSEKFDREVEDVFDIQDEISQNILRAVKIKLLGPEKEVILKNYTENIEAYQLFLKGRYHFNKFSPDDFSKAIEYFKEAIAIDPEYAIAYSGLADCNFDASYFKWLPGEVSINKAIEYAEKGIQIDDNCSECHISSARIELWYHWDFQKALEALEKGVVINPNSVEGNRQLGAWHMIMENYNEANKYLKKADDLDSFSLLNLFYIGGYHVWDGDYEKVIEYGNRLIALEPNSAAGYALVGLGRFGLHQYEEAITQIEIQLKLFNEDIGANSFLAMSNQRLGEKEKAQEIIEKIKNLIGEEDIWNCSLVLIYASMDEWDLAFDHFNRAVKNRESPILYVKSYFRDYFPDMKNDPRTIELIKKIGLPTD
jgi:serine/threonine-protein kinase